MRGWPCGAEWNVVRWRMAAGAASDGSTVKTSGRSNGTSWSASSRRRWLSGSAGVPLSLAGMDPSAMERDDQPPGHASDDDGTDPVPAEAAPPHCRAYIFLPWHLFSSLALEKPKKNRAHAAQMIREGCPRGMVCVFVVFLKSPGGLEATKGPNPGDRTAARVYLQPTTQQARRRAAQRDKTDTDRRHERQRATSMRTHV